MSAEARVTAAPFGTLPDGTDVELLRLESPAGVIVEILTYGATIHRFLVPDADGGTTNVTLGFPTLDDYVTHSDHYIGATVGRVANRIANSTFTLDERTHTVPANDPPHSLHGGTEGFSRCVWEVQLDATRLGSASARLTYLSPDGEMGYPGALDVAGTFTLDESGALTVEYVAHTDAPTVVNIANHTSWNLGGEGSGTALDHVLTLLARHYTPIGPTLIPTGEIAPVQGTPLDFRRPTSIRARIDSPFAQLTYAKGYDHNYVLDPPAGRASPAAHLLEPTSGRTLEVWTLAPGLQVYTGNFLDGSLFGTSGRPYHRGDGISLEPQQFPDAPNRPSFPSIVLYPDEVYRSTTVFRCTGSRVGG